MFGPEGQGVRVVLEQSPGEDLLIGAGPATKGQILWPLSLARR